MKLPLKVAKALLLMAAGEKMPASRLKHSVIDGFLADGVLKKQAMGRQKAYFYLPDPVVLRHYVKNHYGINELEVYVQDYEKDDLSRAEAVALSSDSKLKTIRTFKGFLVNCYQPIAGKLGGKDFFVLPQEGSFTFIFDYETFSVGPEVTIVGIENPENFRYIQKQQHLFSNITPLFVSRYPQTQSKDLIRWLQNIPNPYLHYGDFDLAGIYLYLNEIQQHLGSRASYFIPKNLEQLLQDFGSRKLYDRHLYLMERLGGSYEPGVLRLMELIGKYRKGLEQEIYVTIKERG